MRLQGYITLQCSSCSCENAYISASLSVFQEVSPFQFHSKKLYGTTIVVNSITDALFIFILYA